MPLLEALTDDQIALIGCFASLAVAFGIMSLTWTVRTSVSSAKQPTAAPARTNARELAPLSERRAA